MELPKGFILNFGNPTTFLEYIWYGSFWCGSVFIGLINFSMSLFPLKYVLELYLVIILFDAIILVYFLCYVHVASLCHFINQLNLKKIFSFHFSHFSLFLFPLSLTMFPKPVLFCATFTLTFTSVTFGWGWPKSSFIRYYEKTWTDFLGNPVISLNPDSLFPFVTISLWKMNFLLPPEALFWASLLLSASISDFSRFPQRWPLPLFPPFYCFLRREVGKDQLFQIGHSNCITNNLTSLLYSDWLLSLQDSWDKLLLTSLASFAVFSTLSTVNSGFISLKAQHLSLFKTLNHLSLPFLCSLPGWLLHIFQFLTEKVTSLRSSPWLPSWCSTTLSSLQRSAPFLLVLGIRILHYLPPMLP